VLALFDLGALQAVLGAHRTRAGAAALNAIVARIDDEPSLTRSEAEDLFLDLCDVHAIDARLTVAGYRVVRFTYRQLVRSAATVAAVLRGLVGPSTPPAARPAAPTAPRPPSPGSRRRAARRS
jgi:hypothetical protein